MGLLRLLTNRHVMQEMVLNQSQAWQIYKELRRDERTFFLPEPDSLEARWSELTQKATPSNELWTDCYLQAFAEKWELTIATFDKKFPGAAHSGALILS